MGIEDDNSELQEEQEGEGQGMIGLFGASLILILSILILFSVINYHQFTYGYSINEASDAIETAIVASAVIVIIVAIIFWVSNNREKIEGYIQNKETIEEQELEKIPSLNINELEENKVFALHDASSVIGKNVGVDSQKSLEVGGLPIGAWIALAIVIILIGGIKVKDANDAREILDENSERNELTDPMYQATESSSQTGVLIVLVGIAIMFVIYWPRTQANDESIFEEHKNEPLRKNEPSYEEKQESRVPKKVVKKKSSGSLANELNKLNELKERGILDDDEFKAAKAKLLK